MSRLVSERRQIPLGIREMLEEQEEKMFSPRAQLSRLSRGRRREEELCPLRTAFMRDRDRIIHSKAFRRLKHKTQVFFAPQGDHYRTRLTHTLEVCQISRTIARALRLSEDLTEAIALGHDLGHTPFGHTGEDAITALGFLPRPFRHNEQSLRVVDLLEYDGKGLNLTWEVRDGIVNHTGEVGPATLEGQIVRIADRIAYLNHDVDDAIRAGILSLEELPGAGVELLGRYPSQRIDALVRDLIMASREGGDIRMSSQTWEAMQELRGFMFDRVYTGSVAKAENDKAAEVIQALVRHYTARPEELPPEFRPRSEEPPIHRVCDYVAGMTDTFALRQYEKLFLPRVWTD